MLTMESTDIVGWSKGQQHGLAPHAQTPQGRGQRGERTLSATAALSVSASCTRSTRRLLVSSRNRYSSRSQRGLMGWPPAARTPVLGGLAVDGCASCSDASPGADAAAAAWPRTSDDSATMLKPTKLNNTTASRGRRGGRSVQLMAGCQSRHGGRAWGPLHCRTQL